MQTLSIIIPVYNEEHTINHLLNAVSVVKLPHFKKEIIVVDDGSTDGTKRQLAKWTGRCKVLYQSRNIGKGAAVTRGLALTTGDIVLIQDADLEYDPKDYKVLLDPFNNDQVSVVYGSRFLGPHLSTMFIYAQGNKFVTFMTNLLYNSNITDMETGYKVFRKSIFNEFSIHARRFDFEPEVTAQVLKHGHQIYEVPISYFGRKFSEGKKLTWRDGVVALWTLLKLRVLSD